MPLPDYEDVVALIDKQLGAIRESIPLHAGAPYRLAVLLRHRLDWAVVFDGVRLSQASGKDSIELSLPILENQTPWQEAEARTRLGESPLVLGSAWAKLRPLLVASVEKRLSSVEIARALSIPRDLWDQWISRGRRRLREALGKEYVEAFALWA